MTPVPCIGVGSVWHRRLRPVDHAFRYPGCFLLLPLRRMRADPWPALPRNRWAPIAFHDADHGDGGPDCLAWIEGLLRAEGVDDASGEIWLHCMPRMLGYAFKPVSFWYCHRADGSLAAVLAEVHNTFGERHGYLLHGPGLAFDVEQSARKAFHVSPFCRVDGDYRFRFRHDWPAGSLHPTRTLVRIDHDDADGPLLRTSVGGRLQPCTAAALRGVFRRMPWMTLAVVARIHWQALQLWLRRVPWFTKPDKPPPFVSR